MSAAALTAHVVTVLARQVIVATSGGVGRRLIGAEDAHFSGSTGLCTGATSSAVSNVRAARGSGRSSTHAQLPAHSPRSIVVDGSSASNRTGQGEDPTDSSLVVHVANIGVARSRCQGRRCHSVCQKTEPTPPSDATPQRKSDPGSWTTAGPASAKKANELTEYMAIGPPTASNFGSTAALGTR